MRGYSVSWGVPDFGRTVVRERLNSVLQAGGARFRVITAPSGWGKSIAAAGYAASVDTAVLWIEACGQCVEPRAIVGEILRMRGAGESARTGGGDSAGRSLHDLVDACLSAQSHEVRLPGLLVVVDDFRPDDSAGISGLSSIHARLSPSGVHILVTTRDETCLRGSELRGAVMLGQGALAMSYAECVSLADQFGELDGATVSALREESAGNAALLTLMIRDRIELSGSDQSRRRGPGASLWLDRLAESHLSDDNRIDLMSVALLKQGTESELRDLGLSDTSELLAAAQAIPLLRLSSIACKGDRRFAVHDLAEDWLLEHFDPKANERDEGILSRVCELLGRKGELQRASVLLQRYAIARVTARWLALFGDDLCSAELADQVLLLVGGVGIGIVMGSAVLLRLWAEALLAEGLPEEATGKARAACELAVHGHDGETIFRSRLVLIECLKRLDQHAECIDVSDSLMPVLRSEINHLRRVEACEAIARVNCNVGHLPDACDAIELALELSHAPDVPPATRGRIQEYRALIRALRYGEYSEGVLALSAAIPSLDAWLSERISVRGNLAVTLIETGRLGRAAPLVRYVSNASDGYYRSAFVVLGGLIAAAAGRSHEAMALLDESSKACLEAGCEYDLAANRVYTAVVLRAQGDADAALCEAERAFERLSVMDYMGYRPLAALEIAASLLALDDVVATRRWAETVSADGFSGNAYHALRAGMVLAECDRRDGDLDSAIKRLVEHRDHIVSESSNWQIAMYCRAFPHLLGMFAAAVGPDALPVHMLRMVLPEYAESALRECRGWLDPAQWTRLGQRVLGDVEFSRVDRRKGGPICRVRLFGGLDVALAERTVSERDWKKRKARLLFAMLVVRRGQEVPREQVLDYLWPDLPEERARNNFYVAWSAMKSALMGSSTRSEKCPYLENKGGRLRIVADAVRSDIDEFEEALAEARQAADNDEPDRALSAYARMSTAYRGDLLPGDVYDDWFAPLRDRCRFDFIDAMVSAADLLLEKDDPNEALVYARRAQAAEPLREDLYQAVMRCSIAAGQRNTAIDMFLQLRTRLADDLGLDPSAETMALYQQILVMEDSPRYDDFGLS